MMAAHKNQEAWALVPPQTSQENAHTDVTANQQRLTNLICTFEAAGHAVHKLETGYLISRWGQTRHCPDFHALIGFARQLGVAQ